MKRTILVTFLLCTLASATFAQRWVDVVSRLDDPNVRQDVYNRAELKPLIAEYDDVVKRRIGQLVRPNIAKVFGPKLEQRLPARAPTNSVTPLFAPYFLAFSGLLEGEDRSHRDLYAVGEIGYVEFFYERDDRLKIVVFYALLDDKFVPLKSADAFSKRLEWDKSKFDALKRWLDAHLSPGAGVGKSSSNSAGKDK